MGTMMPAFAVGDAGQIGLITPGGVVGLVLPDWEQLRAGTAAGPESGEYKNAPPAQAEGPC
jgi:hypothetical protein